MGRTRTPIERGAAIARGRAEDHRFVNASPSRRFPFVDAARGVAAAWIVVFHVFEGKHMAHLEPLLPRWLERVIHSGDLAVPVFFALSGFVIAHAIRRHTVSARYLRWFVARRAARLTPPYWASLAVTLGVASLSTGGSPSSGPGLLQVLAHLFYLQDFLRLKPISGIYWTLCLEMQFYVVFCALLAVAHRLRSDSEDQRAQRSIFGVFAIAALVWPSGLVKPSLVPGLFLPMWHTFLIGAFASWALAGTIHMRWLYLYAAALIGCSWHSGGLYAGAAALTAVLLAQVGRAGKLGEWARGRVLGFLGTISYSLYLTHNPITSVVSSWTLYRLTPRTAGWEAFWLAVILAADCVGAYVFWRYVEKPAIILSHRIAPPD